MKTFRQHRDLPVCAVLAATAVLILGASIATAAYDRDSRRGPSQQQYGEQTDSQQWSTQRGQGSAMSQDRNQQLEQQVARQLRDEGFGEQGQILILATGNRVILLGTVPDQSHKQQIEQVAGQAAGTQQIDNRLQVQQQAGRLSDTQLRQSIQEQLPGDLAQDIQVQAQNGRITLQGNVQSWQDVADAIAAAFAAGAQQVASQLAVGGQAQFGMQRESEEYDQPGPSRYGRDTARTSRLTQRWQISAQSRQLQQRLTTQLQSQIRGAEGVTVLASDNAVFLFGRVPDDRAKERATELAESISGIERVENKLIVSEEGWEQQEDATIEEEIQDELWWSPFVDADQVQVRVNNGIATLTGRVDGFGEMAAAIENAYEGGARAVRNQLQTSDRMTAAERDRDAESGYYPPYGFTPGAEDETRYQDRAQREQMRGQQQMTTSDRRLAQQIEQQLRDQLPDANITVTVREGTATLQGSVQNDSQKQQAERIVQSVRGVQNVQNDLTVGTQREITGRQQMGAADTRLAQQVVQQLRQQLPPEQNIEVIQPQSIYVMVKQGTVMLHGFVQDRNQRQQAEQIARSVRGVRNVRNDLQIVGTTGMAGPGAGPRGQPQMTSSDRRLAQQIEQQLQDRLPAANINVTVSRGTVTLQGSVQDDNQKQQAERIAQSIRGVQNVQNNLTVGGRTGDYPPYGYVPGQQAQSRQGMTGQQPPLSTADRSLSQKIQQQLQDRLPGANIHVSVSQGTATLHGSVRDNTQKQQAEQIARSVSGVQNVQNDLTVGVQGMGQSRAPRGQQGRDTEDQFAAGARQGAAGTSDFALAQQVAQKLQQQLSGIRTVQAMRPDTIYVMASQGNVMLHGFVQDRSIQREVEQIARSVRGVRNIDVDLSISGEAGYFPPLGYTPGQEPTEGFGPAGQPMDTGMSGDAQCIQTLKQSITDENLQSIAQDVYVTCHEGKFALYGYVKSDDDKEQLERLTKQVSGITEVENNLVVRPEGWVQKSDAELKQDVESQLWWSPFVDSDKIEVSVQNGVVTLSGQADDWDAMRAAVKNAFDAGPKRVRSNIQYGQEAQQQDETQQESETRPSATNRRSGTY